MHVESTSPLQPVKTVFEEPKNKDHTNNQTPAVSTDTVTISNAALSMEERTKAVMKDYDLKNMPYNNLVKMGADLQKAGVWTLEDFVLNIPINRTLPGHEPKGLEGTGFRFDPEQSMDFIDFFEKELEKLKEINPTLKDSIAFLQNRIDTMHDLNKSHQQANIEQHTA